VPQVLTTNATILCPHLGKGTTVPSNPIWSVNGGFVLLEGDVGTLACPFLLNPCVGYTLQSMGLNATTIAGRKVILVSDFNQSITGLPLMMIETHTTLDNSTPAPIPAGQPAPPLSPALADVTRPVVVAAPPALAFTTPPPAPPTVVATYTLTSPFPMQWNLTLLNETPPSHVDVTNGVPPGLIVAPAGGSWSSPTLVVSITMTALYMAALGPGLHHFYMTGVNQRGLSSFAEVVLTVT
jgi:hypothetical protein